MPLFSVVCKTSLQLPLTSLVLKFSLLRLFRDHPAYPRFAGVEESISQADVGYAQASTCRRIPDAYLWAISSQAGASALVAGVAALVSYKKCWDCGAPGKVRGDGHTCPSPNSGNFDTRGRRGGKGEGGKSGGSGGPKGGSARALSSPRVVDFSQTPPRSAHSARAAYMAREYHQCTAQAQQDAQRSAISAPLPPESWIVPPLPPPPAYGAPPPGAGRAQASYYPLQQQPVPDAQPLGHHSSP